MKFCLPLLVLPLAACAAGSASRAGSADSPFAQIAAEYTVPVALGRALPGQVGGWTEHVTLKGWLQGWTHAPSAQDSDRYFVNFALHPLSGSETHLLARSRGWSFTESFLFDAAASISWEYVFENVYERPSRTDLMVTAPVGALLGELRYQMKAAGILPWLVDPMGEHGRPFVELGNEGFLVGLERRF
ncbi:MAG TPA: DUF3943 domain-containing protein [Planctomycetota bacterium]|nr:DUF3943 domain-containing protein [Planctomycetota bacterium]